MTRTKREETSAFYDAVCMEISKARELSKNTTDTASLPIFALLGELCELAGKAQRYNVQSCNVGLTERQQRMADKVDARAIEIGRLLGLKILTNGDPRGYALKVLLPVTRRYNSFGGEEDGWGVPTL